MKKKMILWCVALICGLAGVFWLQTELLGQTDQVTITEKVVRGNPSLAEGISLRVRTQYYEKVGWDTRFVVGQEEEAVTVFDSTYEQSPVHPKYLLLGIPFNMGLISGNLTIGGNFKNMASCITGDARLEPFREILEELDQQCENGKSKVRTIYLEDHFSHYPVYVSSLANHGKLGLVADGQLHRHLDDREWEQIMTQKMREYFRIPIVKEDRITVGMTKDIHGNITSVWTGSRTENSGENCFYTVTEAGLYFAWSVPAGRYDFSQVPGGYGLYFVPLENVDGVECLILDEIQTVMSLEDADDLGYMWSDTKGDTLIFRTQTGKDESPGLTIVDTAKGKIVQQLGYGFSEEWTTLENGNVNKIFDVVVKDDLLLVNFFDWSFLLYEKNAEGTYGFCLRGRPFAPTEEEK